MNGTEYPREARSTPQRDVILAGALVPLALVAFVMLGTLVSRGATTAFDAHVRVIVLSHRSALPLTVFRWITTVGSVTPMVVYAIVCAVVLARRRQFHGASTLLLAPAGAVVAYLGLKNGFARNRSSGIGNIIEGTYSFPSAHATTSAAVCLALAYICWREGLLGGRFAVTVAVIPPALVGLSRVVLDVHWATDVIGGWVAGLCVASLAAVLYLLARRSGARRPLNEVRT